ncbi:MAG TPA: c-type cytochrome [Burkholderiaceae bacterium]|jgi:cytochrome c5
MSDANSPHGQPSDHHDDGPHEGPIKTPKQLILAVVYAFVIPIAVIVLLTNYVTSDHRPAAGTDTLTSPDAIAGRIRPVGAVQVKDASDLSTLKTGEQVFAAQCTTCHTPGALGAPKFGDADAWGPRIKTGYDALLHSALGGKGQMPAQGGGDFTDLEVGRAVVYMADKAGAKFDEPKATTVAAASAPAAAPVAVAAATPAATPEPAAAVAAAEPAKADAASGPPALFTQVCQACHLTGLAGAPKVGDKAAWGPRLAEGIDGLTATAIKGKGAMPPKGGSTASEADIKAVVTYMVSQAK